jgi:small subunit ribosomal protein S6
LGRLNQVNMKRNYELTIILSEAKNKEVATKKVEALLGKTGGKITKTDFWGKKELAYKIKGKGSGVYTYFELEMAPGEAVELEKRLRIEEGLLRFLLVTANTKVNSQQKEGKKQVEK